MFKENGLGVTIEGNISQTDFLDVWLDLATNSFKPYRKPNDSPVYIDVNSNHPPNIKKELPRMIRKCLRKNPHHTKIPEEMQDIKKS